VRPQAQQKGCVSPQGVCSLFALPEEMCSAGLNITDGNSVTAVAQSPAGAPTALCRRQPESA